MSRGTLNFWWTVAFGLFLAVVVDNLTDHQLCLDLGIVSDILNALLMVAVGVTFAAESAFSVQSSRKVRSKVREVATREIEAQLKEIDQLRSHSPHVARLIEDGRIIPAAAKLVNEGRMTVSVKDFCAGCANLVGSEKMAFTDDGHYLCSDCRSARESTMKEIA